MTTKSPKKLFVTVGSTLFSDLTNLVLSSAFLDVLITLHIPHLIVQLGNSTPPGQGDAKYYHNWESAGDHGEFRYCGGDRDGGVEIRWMRYTDRFEDEIKEADAVISHAGSGSILTVLRTPKPLLVVPNTKLMDNHQEQLADALGKDNYLMVSSVDDLSRKIGDFLTPGRLKQIRPFPEVEGSRFQRILDETAGFT